MATFGFRDWVVVSEAVHLETMRSVLREHRQAHPFAQEVEKVRRVDSLAEAVGDCSWVVGTTPRLFEGRARFTPRELVTEAERRGDGQWALVFGAEANGMTNEDVEQCHAISYLPSSAEQPSINLAQAVLLYAHELSSLATSGQGARLADDLALRRVRAALEERLLRTGLIRHRGEDPQVVEQLMAPLLRAPLREDEVSTWIDALKSQGAESVERSP